MPTPQWLFVLLHDKLEAWTYPHWFLRSMTGNDHSLHKHATHINHQLRQKCVAKHQVQHLLETEWRNYYTSSEFTCNTRTSMAATETTTITTIKRQHYHDNHHKLQFFSPRMVSSTVPSTLVPSRQSRMISRGPSNKSFG